MNINDIAKVLNGNIAKLIGKSTEVCATIKLLSDSTVSCYAIDDHYFIVSEDLDDRFSSNYLINKDQFKIIPFTCEPIDFGNKESKSFGSVFMGWIINISHPENSQIFKLFNKKNFSERIESLSNRVKNFSDKLITINDIKLDKFALPSLVIFYGITNDKVIKLINDGEVTQNDLKRAKKYCMDKYDDHQLLKEADLVNDESFKK